MRNFGFVASFAFLTAWFATASEQPQLVSKDQCTEQATCITNLRAFIDKYDGLTEVELTATGAIPIAYAGEKDGTVSPEEFADPLLRAQFPDHELCTIYRPGSDPYLAAQCPQIEQKRASLLRIHFFPFDVNNDNLISRLDDPTPNTYAPQAAKDNMITREDTTPYMF